MRRSSIILALMFLGRATFAQLQIPHIGYVYPAGGQQGSTFQVVVGGQNLEGATNGYVSGDDIRVVVLEINKPLSQGQFNTLRDELKDLREKEKQAGRHGPNHPSTNTWTAADEKRLAEIKAKVLKNPPNRNATVAIAETALVKITIGTNARPGDRDIRLGSANGLSNPLRFCVSQFPEFAKLPAKAPNPDLDRFLEKSGKVATKPSKPETRIALPSVANGQIMPGAVDRFRFSGRKGQRLVLTVNARALIPYLPDAVPGWFQATLGIYDAKGHELQFADDYRFNPDPVLFFEVPATADYLLEIRDSIYRGREDFVYRITVAEQPFITSILPLGGRVGDETTVTVNGWNLPSDTLRTRFEVAGTQFISEEREGKLCNAVPFAVNALPESHEVEPNDGTASAQPITLPAVVNGRINKAGDVDVFRFEAAAGEEIVAEVNARRLNSPLDSVLKLTDSAGRQIAFNDDHEDKGDGLTTHHADSYLRLKLPAKGTYYLQLRDAENRGGEEFGYRLRISSPMPDFALRIVPSSINLRSGMSAPITVYALRQDGFTNEIELELKNAPDGFKLNGARIPANQEKVRLTLTAPSSANGQPVSLQIEGHTQINQNLLTHPAIAAEDMMQAFAYRHLVPAQNLMANVSSRGMQRRAVEFTDEMPIRIPVGGIARVHIDAPNHSLSDKIHFALSDAPDGITLEKVEPSRKGAELVLHGDTAAKPGLHGNLIVEISVRPQVAKKNSNQPGVVIATLPAIPFEVVPK